MRIVISGGGTGGHITPAIAIAKRFEKLGHEIFYVGNANSMESEYCKKNGFEFHAINVQKLYRYFTFKHLLFPFKLIKSIVDSMRIIKKVKADIFIGTGGFVTGPVGLAAKFLGIPIFLQEQNSFPGITTRYLSKYAKKILLGNKGAEEYLQKYNTFYSGNPISANLSTEVEFEYKKYNLNPEWKTLLILGGSQGSAFINRIIYDNIEQIKKMRLNLIWQIGKREFKKYSTLLTNKSNEAGSEENNQNIHYFDYSYQLPLFYKIADFSVARAGAISLAELEEIKIPSIIIPLPSAAGDHQKKNAKEFEKRGLGICLEQDQSEFFIHNLQYMISNTKEFSRNFGDSIHSNAVNEIVEQIMKSIGEEK